MLDLSLRVLGILHWLILLSPKGCFSQDPMSLDFQLGSIIRNANMRLENGRREKGGRHIFLFLRLHLQAEENLSNGSSFL